MGSNGLEKPKKASYELTKAYILHVKSSSEIQSKKVQNEKTENTQTVFSSKACEQRFAMDFVDKSLSKFKTIQILCNKS